MTDRDRLIELIVECDKDNEVLDCFNERPTKRQSAEIVADYLLANGVIVPPCKVGQTVYIPWRWDGQQGVGFAEVEEIKIYDNKNHIMFFIDLESDDEEFEQQYGGWKLDKSIGDTVFLTKEVAEEKLRELQNAETKKP